MNILIVSESKIPAFLYGGTERIIWWLGKELVELGHKVTYLVKAGSECHFANIIVRNNLVPIEQQVPDDIDVVHFQEPVLNFVKHPSIATIHGNYGSNTVFPINSVFVSKDHAIRHGATAYVYNGIDAAEYGRPDFNGKRSYFHFLGKAAWRVKNVKGAIGVASAAGERLEVLGGTRLNLKMGFRFTPNLNVRFRGMVGGEQKNSYLKKSKGLIFPVRWHEPFGIALIESLYFGCPVFGTPYGSLPEIVTEQLGVLSNSESELAEAIKYADDFDRKACHEYVCDRFLTKDMAKSYLALYEKVLTGASLNMECPHLLPSRDSKFLAWKE